MDVDVMEHPAFEVYFRNKNIATHWLKKGVQYEKVFGVTTEYIPCPLFGSLRKYRRGKRAA
jgi:hypothetical protein